MTPLIGFSPDAEPTTPGVMTDCENLIPYEAGFRAAPQPVTIGLPALSAECRGSAVLRSLSGEVRMFAGTDANLYEASGTAWIDVSETTAGYTLSEEDRWSFAAFGTASLVATPTQRIQRSTSGAFAEISGAPKAKIIESVTNFVLAFATDETTFGDSPDRWWCCAIYDETSWTANVSTQATTGRLLDGYGSFTAAKRFGSDVVAYKERGVFVGRYSGAPVVFDWTPVSEDVGCVGQDAVAVTSIGHVFVGTDNIYLFDGTRPIPLATDTVRQWWIDNRSSKYIQRTRLLWDRFNNLVWIYFPGSASSGACDTCLVFHTLSRRWGRADSTIEAVVIYITTGSIVYDSGSSTITDFDSGPGISFDSVLWLQGAESPAIFDSAHQIKTLNGDPDESSFTTGDVGDVHVSTMCDAVRLLYSRSQEEATCTGYTRAKAGGALTETTTADLADGKFDMRQTARYHRFRFDLTGDVRFSAADYELKPAGRR